MSSRSWPSSSCRRPPRVGLQARSPLTQVSQSTEAAARAGNPVFPGWYADPEAHIFDGRYWIYPTYSARYEEQTFMDRFSSTTW